MIRLMSGHHRLSREGGDSLTGFTPSASFELGHPVFRAPPDAARLWRYMSFTKYVSLVATSSLWFANTDRLGDPWEGTYTKANLARRSEQIGAGPRPDLNELLLNNLIATERSIYASCWHENDGESTAMWKLYLASDEGIAVQTTWERLIGCLGEPERPTTKIIGGRVRYVDPDAAPVDADDLVSNSFTPHTTKRLSFAHERETRLLMWAIDPSAPGPTTPEINVPGIRVPVDLWTLVEGVYLAPDSPSWFQDLVRDVTTTYQHAFRLYQSELAKEPTSYRLRHPTA
jgi:hypothetical protein